jgi:hypothetical protein
MLDRSNLSKFFLFVLLTIVISCSEVDDPEFGIYHTELICADRDVVMIRYAKANEVKQAIKVSHDKKKKLGSGENYTVISFSGNRSMKIDNLAPEEALKCNLREIFYPRKDKYKKKYMESPTYTVW